MSKSKEYRCKYCGGKGADFCKNCQIKLGLVRDLLTMVRNKAEEIGYYADKEDEKTIWKK